MINTEALAAALSKLAADIISGKTPEIVEVDAKVKMPKQIYEVLGLSAQSLGIDVSELISKVASQGISKYLEEANSKVPNIKKETVDNPTGNIEEKVGQITDLLSKLRNMTQVLDGIQGNTTKNK